MKQFREIDGAAVGARIAALRKRLGMTQEEFAEKLGVAPVTVRRMETGERGPNRTMLFRISQCFDVSLDVLADPDAYAAASPGIAADYGVSVLGEEPMSYHAGPLPEKTGRGGAFGEGGLREKEKLKALIGEAIDEMPVEIARQAAALINGLRNLCRDLPGEE